MKSSSENKTKVVPSFALSFGHGVSRGFVRPRGRGGLWHQGRSSRGKPKENEVSMTDLEEALPVVE